MLSVADLSPSAVGVNVTLILHDAPALSDVPQSFVWVKSPLLVPMMVMLPIGVGAEVVFMTVTVRLALFVPKGVEGNVSEPTRMVSLIPVPASETE
jgi:hypothetical protein